MKTLFLTFMTTLFIFQFSFGQDKEEHQEQWETHHKIYIYADGSYIATNTPLKKSKDVALLILRKNNQSFKDKEGKLPKVVLKEILKDSKSYNPSDYFMQPPCCPVYDKHGNYLYTAYDARCVWPCYKEIKGGKLNCCYNTYYRLYDYLKVVFPL